MAIRIQKLAKELRRSEAEVLEVAASLGLPQKKGTDQLAGAAEARLRKALNDLPAGGRLPREAPPHRVPEPPPSFHDPLADTWMDLAMADEAGLAAAQVDNARDRQVNRPQRFKPRKEAEARPRPTWEEDEAPRTLDKPRGSRPAATRPKDDKSPDEVLKGLGFHGASARKDLAPLLPEEIAALLSHTHLSPGDAKRITAAIGESIARCCGDAACQQGLAATGKVVILVSDQGACDYCQGSNTRRSVGDLIAALDTAGIQKILVVGGSPNSHEELRGLLPARFELKLVPGTKSVTLKQARDHLVWSELAAIWAPTQLDHKVSNNYRGRRTGTGRKAIHVEHRSVEFLAQAILTHLAGDPS